MYKIDGQIVRPDAYNLIYNRFDLLYEYIEEIKIENFKFQIAVLNQKILVNVWGKFFQQDIFDEMINAVLRKYKGAFYIQITKSYNNYKNQLHKTEDIVLYLPQTEDVLFSKLSSKHRYNLNRSQRLMEEISGSLSFKHFERCNIDDGIVEQYFEWKKKTHGTDYKLSPKEYLAEYHVTDALLLLAGKSVIGIIFYCKVDKTVYLENLSYDIRYEKYSPGFLAYTFFLRELIAEGCEVLYLGGGNYSYKKHFGTAVYKAYTGRIYTDKFYDRLNKYMEGKDWLTYGIYGLGECGKSFLVNVDRIKGKLVGGIDREKKNLERIETYVWGEDDMPMADVIFITMALHVKEVEDELKSRFKNVYYWDDVSAMIQDTEVRVF